MNEYLGRIKHQVMQWFTNIKNLPLETQPGEDGTIITTNPEDMFRVLSLQVAVAEEKLPKEKLKDVIMTCLQVLREIQRDTYDALRTSYKDMDPMLMCATINDNLRMEEKCANYFGDRIAKLPASQSADREMLTAVLDDVETEYVEIANKAVAMMAKTLLQCDLEGVLAALFTREWEAGEAICDAIPATLADVFPSLEEWLGSFMLGRVAWSVLQALPEYYLTSLVKNCNLRFTQYDASGNNTLNPAQLTAQAAQQAAASASQLKRELVAAGKQAAWMAAQAAGVDDELSTDDEGEGGTGAGGGSAGNYRFKNELVAAAQVQSDMDVLSDFFYEYVFCSMFFLLFLFMMASLSLLSIYCCLSEFSDTNMTSNHHPPLSIINRHNTHITYYNAGTIS
jgi:hypothetical protein